ncbi:hypothetical protein Glove_84g79 [Diversispora epigaea]|uniref:Uncharacterized protein n=1 Tax=Diversispora epigaea TaxID=1348612 RepID=A0A397JI47_9GLOM|nr:hypothetical protein Glove_84g79 [Diversispora epigaea]
MSICFKNYKKAAECDGIDGQYEVGKCLYEGRGTKKDIINAIYWLNKAKENEDIDTSNSKNPKSATTTICDSTGESKSINNNVARSNNLLPLYAIIQETLDQKYVFLIENLLLIYLKFKI